MYLIDGHNLIGQLSTLSLDDPHDEAKLVEQLKRYAARTGKRCVVVFDNGLPGGLSRDLSTANVRVVFAHGGTTADAIILERIREAREANSLIVVSADRQIVETARRRRIQVESPATFAAALEGSPTPDGDGKAEPPLPPAEIEAWLRLFDEKGGS